MTDRALEKVINRFKEATRDQFKKIPQGVIRAEQVVNLIRDEIKLEKEKSNPSKTVIQLLESRLIAALRVQTQEEIKAGLRK